MTAETSARDDLAARIGAGDTEAFARWLASAEPALRASLRRFAHAVDVESVLQETLLRIWQGAPRFVSDGKPDGLLRLAMTIARNLAVSECRRFPGVGVDPEDIENVAGPNPDPPSDPLLRRAIAECLRRLPPRPAAALGGRITSGGREPDATIARRLGMTLNAFFQNITRARRLVLDCLRRRGIHLAEEMA